MIIATMLLMAFCIMAVRKLTKSLLDSWEFRKQLKHGKELRQRILNGEE